MYYSWEIYSNFHSVLYSISLEFKIEPNPIDIGKFLIFTSYSFLFISFTIFIVKLLHTINFLCSFNIFIHEYFHLIQSFFYSFRSYKASYSSPIHDHKFKNTTQSNRTLIFHIIFFVWNFALSYLFPPGRFLTIIHSTIYSSEETTHYGSHNLKTKNTSRTILIEPLNVI